MPSNYPEEFDLFPIPGTNQKVNEGSYTHAHLHRDLGLAIEAVEGTLGLNPQGEHVDVNARLADIELETQNTQNLIGDLSNDVSDVEQDITTLEQDVAAVEQDIVLIQQDIETLETDKVYKAGDTMTGGLTIDFPGGAPGAQLTLIPPDGNASTGGHLQFDGADTHGDVLVGNYEGELRVAVGGAALSSGQGVSTMVGYAIGPLADQAGIGSTDTDLTGMSVAFTADASRVYLTQATLHLTQRTSTGAVVLTIRDSGGTILRENRLGTFAINQSAMVEISFIETGDSGLQTRKLSLRTSGGTVEVEGSDGRFSPQMWILNIGAA